MGGYRVLEKEDWIWNRIEPSLYKSLGKAFIHSFIQAQFVEYLLCLVLGLGTGDMMMKKTF